MSEFRGPKIRSWFRAGLDLSSKTKEGRCSITVPQQNSEFIQDVVACETLQLRTLMRHRGNFINLAIEKLDQLGEAMAKNIVK